MFTVFFVQDVEVLVCAAIEAEGMANGSERFGCFELLKHTPIFSNSHAVRQSSPTPAELAGSSELTSATTAAELAGSISGAQGFPAQQVPQEASQIASVGSGGNLVLHTAARNNPPHISEFL